MFSKALKLGLLALLVLVLGTFWPPMGRLFHRFRHEPKYSDVREDLNQLQDDVSDLVHDELRHYLDNRAPDESDDHSDHNLSRDAPEQR